MSKLFKKLNNQVEVSNVKSKAITEQEMKEVENKMIFENLVDKINKDTEIKD